MQKETLDIQGLVLIHPKRFGDNRGYFQEVFKEAWFRENVANVSFVQENESLSADVGTMRGLHYQTAPFEQGKLVRCLSGALLDVAVDIRKDSPTLGKWIAQELSPENGMQLWIPAGFAHGFITLKPNTVISYKVTAPYAPNNEGGIRWDDPDLNINWPQKGSCILSDKDLVQPLFKDYLAS